MYRTRRRVAKKAATATLLGALPPEQRQGAAQAFLDPAAALRDMGHYCYAVETVPAPFLGAIPRPGLHGSARIDRFGLRGTAELEPAKPRGALRVFLLGGSTAFGSGAPDQARTPAGYLEAALRAALPGRQVQVFACACPAWTSHHERIAAEQRLRAWDPDLVLALSGANDAEWGWLRRDPAWTRTYEDEHFFRLASDAMFRAGLGELPDVAPAGEVALPAEPLAAGLARNARLTALALEPVPYLLCLQPVLPCTRKPTSVREAALLAGWPAEKREHFQRVWARYAADLSQGEARGLRWRDLDPAFAARPAEEELFLDAFHFGDRGNALLGTALAEAALPLLRGE